jgi:hypothetical protein
MTQAQNENSRLMSPIIFWIEVPGKHITGDPVKRSLRTRSGRMAKKHGAFSFGVVQSLEPKKFSLGMSVLICFMGLGVVINKFAISPREFAYNSLASSARRQMNANQGI